MTSATESVLLGLKHSATSELSVPFLNREVEVSINHVLQLVATGHLPALVHLSDDNSVDHVFLAVISDHFQRADRSLRSPTAILVLPVIHRLQRVDNEEEGLTRIPGSDRITLLEQGGNVSLTADHEAVMEMEAFSNHLDLVEALLAGVAW